MHTIYNKANWELYQNIFEQELKTITLLITTPEYIKIANYIVIHTIQIVLGQSVPQEKIILRSKMLSVDITQHIRYKRHLIRIMHERPSEFIKQKINQLNKEIKKKIREFREHKITEHNSTLSENYHKNPKLFWKTISTKSNKTTGKTLPSSLDSLPKRNLSKSFTESFQIKQK